MDKEEVVYVFDRIPPAIKKNEILPSEITWMDLEGIMLSEVSDRERQILYNFTYMWHLKNKINEQTKQKS